MRSDQAALPAGILAPVKSVATGVCAGQGPDDPFCPGRGRLAGLLRLPLVLLGPGPGAIITRAAQAAGRPAPRIVAGIPVCLCLDDEIDAAVTRTNRILAEAEVSPNYQRLLERGDARTVGDILAAGSESSIEKRLGAFADAGVTDVSARIVPIGDNREELIASARRTRDFLASLARGR